MYRKKDNQQTINDFILPFGGALADDNRWVVKSRLIPWDEIEGDYSDLFPSGTGNVAKPARLAFGALVIKETLGLTDEETVEQIRENPYLQYFLGYKEYTNEKPFDPSLMVRFRKRFSAKKLNAINEDICKQDKKDDDEPPATGGGPGQEVPNQETSTYFNLGCADKSESWQVLAPVRGLPHGVANINHIIHGKYRTNYTELAKESNFWLRKIPRPFGSEGIVYGD